jgi:hypothetical protein
MTAGRAQTSPEPKAQRETTNVPLSVVVIVDVGYFALDTKADETVALVRGFMKSLK